LFHHVTNGCFVGALCQVPHTWTPATVTESNFGVTFMKVVIWAARIVNQPDHIHSNHPVIMTLTLTLTLTL